MGRGDLWRTLGLARAGLLDRASTPVTRPTTWRAFPAITVRRAIARQGGHDRRVITAPASRGLRRLDLICSRLAAQQPAWAPGTAHGESALFYGHLVGELVRRVDGRSVGEFLVDEVTGPRGLDFAFGLNADQASRAVELTGLGEQFMDAAALDRPDLYRRAMGNPAGALDESVVKLCGGGPAEVPAINGHGTARAVAGFYVALAEGSLLASTTWPA